jgi:selenoprotein W-related protein
LKGALEKKHKDVISEIELIESAGGAYEIRVDGNLIYSKLETGRHVDPPEIMELFEEYIKEQG